MARYPKIDLSFLDGEEEEKGGAKGGERGAKGGERGAKGEKETAESEAPPSTEADGCSEAAPTSEVAPPSIPSEAAPASLLLVESEQPAVDVPSSSIEPHIEVNDI